MPYDADLNPTPARAAIQRAFEEASRR